ncbi:MAG TPA: ArsR family transcriptional regulator [Conexibacter sp.]|jgi:DNA-binding transcriptional ArsR family regulator
MPNRALREIPHPATEALSLAAILRTCGEPVRLEMIRLLADAQDELRAGQVVGAVGLPTSTCSYHLRLLREAGVTRTRAVGTERYITLRQDDLDTRFPGLLQVLLAE